jgi:ubiquinone/menaquinone biosynthesis C-methylase UbiE
MQAVQKYFADKADQYDAVDQQTYWQLSDRLLWQALDQFVLKNLPAGFRFCDAGGGTGRWSLKVLQNYASSQGVTVDFSAAMLEQARAKCSAHGLTGRWELLERDLHAIDDIPSESFDLVFNFHNVIGFVADPEKVIFNLKRILKSGGVLCTLAPNAYHAAFFNLKNGNLEETRKAIAQKGRFTTQMPDIHLFTPDSLKALMDRAGLTTTTLTGFPSLIYPGYAETQLHGQTQSLADMLSDPEMQTRIFEIEKSVIGHADVAARGNNIFIAATKP